MTDPRARAAAAAVQFFWSWRHDLADTEMLVEAIEAVRETSRQAKAENRRITDEEWIELAELIDGYCDDEGLPRLFEQREAA